MAAYREMLLYYGVKTLIDFFTQNAAEGQGGSTNFQDFQASHPEKVSFAWENLGGQLVPEEKVRLLREAIRAGTYTSWAEIHQAYRDFQREYPLDKALNALQVLRFLQGGSEDTSVEITPAQWNSLLDEAARVRHYIEEQVYRTKRKDYQDPFRNITYRNEDERDAVLGKLEVNPFVRTAKEETTVFLARLETARLVAD
jgi:hypothetical protein